MKHIAKILLFMFCLCSGMALAKEPRAFSHMTLAEIVSAIDAGYNVAARDQKNATALMWAAAYNSDPEAVLGAY
jgi:hypothetical protein